MMIFPLSTYFNGFLVGWCLHRIVMFYFPLDAIAPITIVAGGLLVINGLYKMASSR